MSAESSGLALLGAGWTYPESTVGPIDLAIEPGELVLLTGPTGCGKSTVLRLAAGLLQRHGRGRLVGSVRVGGRDPAALVARERVRTLAFVGQDPDDTIVTGSCAAEVAFAAESAGFSPEEIENRVAELLERLGLSGLGARAPAALSGGQRQRLAIAAALSAGARILLLDEPLSQLDPTGATEVLAALRTLADSGVAVLLVEHRVAVARPFVDRVLHMADGRLVSEPEPPPVLSTSPPTAPGDVVVRLDDVRFSWTGREPCIRDVSLALRAGERIAIVGPNGAGKSTLLGLLSGRLVGTGTVARHGAVIEVPQNPDLALFSETVAEELAYGPTELGHADVAGEVRRCAEALAITDLLDRPPQALSRGQRLRVAVAAALACRPAVLVLDEPTSGQDLAHVERMFAALPAALRDGDSPAALVFASHDLDIIRRHATRVLRVEGGRLVEGSAEPSEGSPAHDTSDVSNVDRSGSWLDPRSRLALLACVGTFALVADRALTLGSVAAGLALAVLAHPRARGWRLRMLGGAALLAWSTAFSQGLFWAEWPRTPLVVLSTDPWLAISREGVVHGLVQSLRFLLVAAAGAWVTLTTAPDRLLTALLALRIPFGIALMGSTALRFLPMVGAEAVSVRRARAHRGRPLWRRSPSAWLALEVALLRPVVARSLRRARALAESLETRGFHPTAPRAVREPLRWGVRDSAVVGLTAAVTLAAVVARLLYVAYGAELYYAPALRPLYAFVRGWL